MLLKNLNIGLYPPYRVVPMIRLSLRTRQAAPQANYMPTLLSLLK